MSDAWTRAASTRVVRHMTRAAARGRNYAPDQTPELNRRGQVGPKSAAIARILKQHADLWAQDARTATAAGIDFDADVAWASAMLEADLAIDRFLAGHTLARGAA